MNIYRINTSAWEEEDFFLLTTLSEQQIRLVIQPMVDIEREEDQVMFNDEYLESLRNAYPKEVINQYNEIETLNF